MKWHGELKPYWPAVTIGAVSGMLLLLIVCGMASWRYRSTVRLNNNLTLNIASLKQAAQEKAKLDAQLLQSQKIEAVGQLAGGVAHDFQ